MTNIMQWKVCVKVAGQIVRHRSFDTEVTKENMTENCEFTWMLQEKQIIIKMITNCHSWKVDLSQDTSTLVGNEYIGKGPNIS